MKKKTIVYKVVTDFEDGRGFSCFTPPALELEYSIGNETFPKVGKIFCFETLAYAYEWKNIWWRILRCETDTVYKMYIAIPGGSRDEQFEETYRLFWENPKEWIKSRPIIDSVLPKGTVFCDSITPLEVIG